MVRISVNNKLYDMDIDPDMPVLWALRDILKLMGTKYSCGQGLCGCCTVLVGKQAIRSCITPVSAVVGENITTIEGLPTAPLHPVLAAWDMAQASQCGYCQPGQVMSAIALLTRTPDPSNEQINAAMNGNLCRCGSYQRIRQAIKLAASQSTDNTADEQT